MSGVHACERVEPNTARPTAVPLRVTGDRGKAVIVACASLCTEAFLIMSAVGCKTNGAVAYIPVIHIQCSCRRRHCH